MKLRGRGLESRTSIVARRPAAVAPESHWALTAPLSGELSMTGFSPRSSSILSRFGITVSTLSVLAKRAPPTSAGRVPVAGGRIGRGLELEGIELAHRRGIGQRLHQLTARIAQLERHRVVRRQGLRPVLQREGQVDGIAGAPDAAVAVEIALESRDHGLAAHVEMAHRQRHAGRHAQVALASADRRR